MTNEIRNWKFETMSKLEIRRGMKQEFGMANGKAVGDRRDFEGAADPRSGQSVVVQKIQCPVQKVKVQLVEAGRYAR